MWNIFKKKEKKAEKDIYQILLEYIAEARKMGHSDYWIRNKFKSKNYTDKLINLVFEIDKLKGGEKMVIKKKHKGEIEDEDYDTDESEEQEDSEEVEEDAEEEAPKKKVKPKKVEEETEEETEVKEEPKKITNEQIVNSIIDLNNRVANVESALFRLKSI